VLKVIGAAMVVLAGGIAGMQLAKYYARRPRELKSMMGALLLLKTEIGYAATPLPEALTVIAKRADPAVSHFFHTAAAYLHNVPGATAVDAWSRALAEAGRTMALREEDVETLQDLGASLGGSCREEQVRHIALAIERLKASAASAETDAGRYVRLYNFLGFGAGLTVVILLC